jgi:succinate dehydrogenase / fumarate reductase iron-sulfur subunit
LVDPVQWAEAEPYTNCILCASCYGVCPAAARDPEYLGPAALAKHYRFLADVRDVADEERIALVDSEQGVWGCDMVWSCVEVCPKGVPPTQSIGKTRARIRRAQRARKR